MASVLQPVKQGLGTLGRAGAFNALATLVRGVSSASGSKGSLSAVSEEVARVVGLFKPKSVHLPEMPTSTQQIFHTLHQSGSKLTSQFRDMFSFNPAQSKDWYDPKFIKPKTFLNLQQEVLLETGAGFRQIARFNLYFKADSSDQASEESWQAIANTFGVSESDAKAFYAEVHQLSQRFREENNVECFREVIVLVNGISQFTTGPVKKGQVLLLPHLDGAPGQKQSTFLYRGAPESDPLHGLVLTPERDAEPIEAATGFIVFSQVLHAVHATGDSDVPRETFSVTLGFTAMPLPGEQRVIL